MSTLDSTYRGKFGQRLQAARKRLCINQTDFAGRVGVSKNTLSRYERGELSPPADTLAAIALELRDIVDADWLLFGLPEDLERPEPVVMDNFGALVRLRFGGQGTAEVSMGSPEVERVLQACAAFELRKAEPDKHVLDLLKSLIEYYSDDGADVELLARVVIAQRSVRLTPEILEGAGSADERSNNEILDALHWMYSDNYDSNQKDRSVSARVSGVNQVKIGGKVRKKK